MQEGGHDPTIREVCLTPPSPIVGRVFTPPFLSTLHTLSRTSVISAELVHADSQQTYYYIPLNMYNALESTRPLHCLIDPRELLYDELYTVQF
jgi:hypothetical protein